MSTGPVADAPPPSATTRTSTVGDLAIAYDAELLEPRPWTVMQSEWAVELAAAVPTGPILEVCSGAGHIGLVAARRTDRRLLQVDRDPQACRFARANADAAGLGGRVTVRCMTIAALADHLRDGHIHFPLVIADPPYIPTSAVDQYPEDPRSTIDGGADGLELVRACVDLIDRALDPGGQALLQLGGRHHLAAVAAHAPPSLALIDHRNAGPTRFVARLARPPVIDPS
jgi:methylase of polypeptide subunit release factors